jgi:hypothetical protein
MPSRIVKVGVDLGGTWIRLKAADESGRQVRALRAPVIPRDALPRFLKRIFQHWRARPKRLAVASRGVWTLVERRALARSLRGLADRILVMSDVEAAWLAAFNKRTEIRGLRTDRKNILSKLSPQHSVPSTSVGIIVIAGTGSVVYGRDACGHVARAGGLGPLLGDEGSAFWISREWLKRQRSSRAGQALFQEARAAHTTVRRIAAYAPGVIRRARNGQRTARDVIHLAQRHLAALVLQTVRSLHWKGSTIPISTAGSVLENRWFQNGFWRALRETKKYHWEAVIPDQDGLSVITYG